MKSITSIVGLLFLLILGACTDAPQVVKSSSFNSDLKTEVPDNFDWATTQSINAIINPVDDYNGKFMFKISIFASDPSANKDVMPVAVGMANMNEPFMQKVTIPLSSANVYITQSLVDAEGNDIIIASNKVSVDKLTSVQLSKTESRADTVLRQTLPELCDGLKDLSSFEVIGEASRGCLEMNSSSFYAHKSYVVKSDCDIKIDNNSFNCADIYIMPGVNVRFIQKNDGTDFTIGAHTQLYNDGCITVLNGDETMKIKEDAVVYNNGTITCTNIIFEGKYNALFNTHFYKYSSIFCKNLYLNSGVIVMDTGSYINTDYLSCSEGKKGVICIDETIYSTPKNISNYNYAALFIVNKAITNSSRITINGYKNAKLLIQCPKDGRDGLDTSGRVKYADFVEDAAGLIFIPKSNCSPGYGVTKTKLCTVTYCMEDQYPNRGDFDLNDVVVEITPTLVNSSGVVTVDIDCEICAVGASKTISGYIMVNGTETELFANAHKEMGKENGVFVNTVLDCEKTAHSVITKDNIKCNSDFCIDDLVFFIRAGGENIYAADQGSINIDKQIIGGVRLMTKGFKYPIEKLSITEAYNEDGHKIADWISSNRAEAKDWYECPTECGCFE